MIYVASASPAGTLNIAGGMKGSKINSTCATTTGSNGSAGIVITNYDVMESGAASGCVGTILDVSWKFVKAEWKGNAVWLQWSLTQPVNGRFTVERKTGNDWQTIQTISTNGEKTLFATNDRSATSNFQIYRIRLETNGSTKISPLLKLEPSKPQAKLQYLPGTHQLYIQSNEPGSILLIYDAEGKCLIRKTVYQPSISIDVSFFKPGLYFTRMGSVVYRWVKE